METIMKNLFLISAAAVLVSTGAFAQTTVTTTTATGHDAAVQIKPEYRTRIRTFVTEHKVRPVETRERIVVGSPIELIWVACRPTLATWSYEKPSRHGGLCEPEGLHPLEDGGSATGVLSTDDCHETGR
jgi:hypothetical protein